MSLPLVDAVQQLVLAQAAQPQMSFDLVHMWGTMGFFAKFIAAILGIMSIYSLGVMAERLVTYARASSASRQYAEQLRGLLPQRKYSDAVTLAKRLKRGHLAKVLGLAIEEYERGVNALRHHGPEDVGEFEAGLAARIAELLADPDRAAAMGAAGRERVLAEFGWPAIAQETVELYAAVLGSA